MALLDDKTRTEIRRRLSGMAGPVKVMFFQDSLPSAGEEGEQMLMEISDLSRHVRPVIFHPLLDRDAVRVYGVGSFPAFVLEGPTGTRLRFLGLPKGFGFSVFFESLKDAASGSAALCPEARLILKRPLRRPVHIRVFVTPDCMLGPMASRAAQKLAVMIPGVSAEIIQAQEFPELVGRYGITSVPELVINDSFFFRGAPAETTLADLVLLASY